MGLCMAVTKEIRYLFSHQAAKPLRNTKNLCEPLCLRVFVAEKLRYLNSCKNTKKKLVKFDNQIIRARMYDLCNTKPSRTNRKSVNRLLPAFHLSSIAGRHFAERMTLF